MVVSFWVISTVNTSTTTLSLAEHPLASVLVTEYVPAVVTVKFGLVEPSLHK